MPKRKRDETKEERWDRKRKRYEEKLQRKRNLRVIYSSDDEFVQLPTEENVQYDVDVTDIAPVISEDGVVMPPPEEVSNQRDIEEIPITDPDFDTELLKSLGDFEDEPLEWGENIQEEIAKRFERVLSQGMKKDENNELTKRYLFPKNSPSTKAPLLNPELTTNLLQESTKTRDKRLFEKQNQLGRALSALGAAMTALLKKSVDKSDVMQKLNDLGKFLSDSHYAETETRRALIIPLIDKSLVDSFKDRKRDSFLFGDKLCDLVKNSRGILRTSQIIQGPAASTSSTNLNWRGPPHRQRQYRAVVSGPSQQSRGGQRSRRLPPPPPPPRRQPPPPPPPPRRRQPPPRSAAQYPPGVRRN